MSSTQPGVQAQCNHLRLELKQWEKDFASSHGGRKAGRNDIKACADIAAKYKEYNRLRGTLSGKPTLSSPSKKRQAADQPLATPSKRRPIPSTPSKVRIAPIATPSRTARASESAIMAGTPSSKLNTPAISRTIIGPTPQKDGVAIGLFDFLTMQTPTKQDRTVLGDIPTNVLQTPSRQQLHTEEELCATGRLKGSKTPLSTGKRFFLDSFIATPMKRKRLDENTEEPTDHSSTPTFLRRNMSLDNIMEEVEEEATQPRVLPWKRKGLVRSLSSMIQGMKDRKEEEAQEEEDRLDDDLDLLREMEAEEAGVDFRPIKKPKVLVQDSQAAEMPLGPDQLVESDQDDDQTERPTRVYKKRGQKRTTRRVNMRPVQMKPMALPTPHGTESDSQSDAESDDHKIEGTAVPKEQIITPGEDDDSADEFALGDAGSESDDDLSKPPAVGSTKKKEATKAATVSKESTIKKVVRKVNEHAHANYRRLKIKNKNSKAKGRGRFGRR